VETTVTAISARDEMASQKSYRDLLGRVNRPDAVVPGYMYSRSGPQELAVYVALSWCANAEGRVALSIAQFADFAQMSESAVVRALRILVGEGFVVKESAGAYRLCAEELR
jgi:hypothetical protein